MTNYITISGNTAKTNGGGTFELSGVVSVTGNTADSFGGGVMFQGGTFEISGSVSITGNTAGNSNVEDNLALKKGLLVTVDDGLTPSSSIGVNLVANNDNSSKQLGVVTTGYGTYISTAELKYFHLDKTQADQDFVMVKNSDNEVEIIEATDHTVTYIADGVTLATVQVAYGDDVPQDQIPEIPAKIGYDQTPPRWDDDGTNIIENRTIHALYTINTYSVTYQDENGGTVKEIIVAHGDSVPADQIPSVPDKTGYTGVWDHDGKNITSSLVIKPVYTAIPQSDIDNLPKTGDNGRIALWFCALALSSVGMLVFRRRPEN